MSEHWIAIGRLAREPRPVLQELLRLMWKMALGVFLFACPMAYGQSGMAFRDVTVESGISFRHFNGKTGQNFIIETVAAGIATLDYNNDGLLDVYFLNGSPLPHKGEPVTSRAKRPNIHPRNRLFRNDGGFRFTDVTDASGAGDDGFALGVVAGDYDNDGDDDLFVSNFGPTVLLENQGDGTFVRREFEAPEKPRVGAGLALFDIERDGTLDLYVANYVDFTFEKKINRKIFGVPAAPGPKDFQPDRDCLYKNNGAGDFHDVSQTSGIALEAGTGMGVVAFDFEGDGDTDVFVCNDSAPNFLFENLGDGTFVESALLAGVAYDYSGAEQASMGVDIADFNRDGFQDLATTNFMDEIPTLYMNSGQGFFDDLGPAGGLGVAARSVTWGIAFADFDNDSWHDLFLAAGHLIDGVTQVNDSEKFRAPNVLLRNQVGKRFVRITDSEALEQEQVSRGVVADDFDRDGRVDLMILNLNDGPQILRNESPSHTAGQSEGGTFIEFKLVGKLSSRDPAGAKVTVKSGDQEQVQELVLGRGYQGHFGTVLHYGLGDSRGPVDVSVGWPNGQSQSYVGLSSGAQYLLVEGQAAAQIAR